MIQSVLGDFVSLSLSPLFFHREGNDPADSSRITFDELLYEVCKFSNVLKSKG